MPKDYSQVVTDITELVRELEVARRHIEALEAQVLELKAEPVKAPLAWNPNLFKRVDELEISVRSMNCCLNADIEFIWQLVERDEVEMYKRKHFGKMSINEIKEVLADLDLTLGMKLGDDFPRTTKPK